MTATHGGNIGRLAEKAGIPTADLLDFSANINPLGPPEDLRRVISSHWDMLSHYPDPEASALLTAIADRYQIDPCRIIMGNGSTEILYAIPRALAAKRAVIPEPCYADYRRAAALAGLPVITLSLKSSNGFAIEPAEIASIPQAGDLLFIGRPNNPTGAVPDYDDLITLAKDYPQTFFVVDESFADFDPECQSVMASELANLIVVRSLAKFYAIPGLRLGFATATPELTVQLRRYILPWSINTLAQAAGIVALGDEEYGNRTRESVSRLRRDLTNELSNIAGLKVYPSHANFLLVELTKHKLSARQLSDTLLGHGIAIRVCDNFTGLPDGGANFFRLAVRTTNENQRLIAALTTILIGTKPVKAVRKPFSLMLQGTSSNAGKSVLTAAFCRILLQDGLRVAPFKAQNMSLNSYVTRDGLEMGRAQVVQAQACCLDPEVRMNPVLLKPMSDMGCQVIVNGRPVGNMSVSEYVAYKPTAWQAVCRAYDALLADYDGVILEGAGSPGEVNLKHHDIVNMRMAQYAQAPVLLVGDIDRGGVFASFIGTMEVLSDWERNLIAGFVVNRFRGKRELLEDGLTYTRDFTNRPVLGVIPYLHPLGLPEEDSVSYKAGLYEAPRPTGEHVEIALIDLPHISNFTDFEPFLGEPDVHLRVIRTLADLEKNLAETAVVVLPGSKNVINDLGYLKQTGLADCIKRMADQGIEIVGICGGFQMLGNTISDPHGLESGNNALVSGLGLLNLVTVLEQDKTLTRQTGVHQPSGLPVYGYEIHHGQSTSTGRPVLRFANNDEAGAATPNDLIWGSYLHGIFDADQFRRWFIDRLRQRRGLQPVGKPLAIYDLEPAFDRLAETVRGNMDMNTIYRLLGL